jgi:hypothetical protein
MTIEYYVETPRGKRLQTCETSEQAVRQIEGSSNIVRFSPDAIRQYVEQAEAAGRAV